MHNVHFEGGWDWGSDKKEILLGVRGGVLASVLYIPYLFFILKKIGFSPGPDNMPCQTLIYY